MLTDDDVMQAYMDSGLDTDWFIFEMVTFACAVIAANNAKVLADMKPVGFDEGSNFLWREQVLSRHTALYSADQVSALIQRNAELEAMLKPFGALSQPHQDRFKDADPMFAVNGSYITYGDVRKALKVTS